MNKRYDLRDGKIGKSTRTWYNNQRGSRVLLESRLQLFDDFRER